MRRLADRPLITPADVPPSAPDRRVVGAFNPGAARIGDEIVLLLRVAETVGHADDVVVSPAWDPVRGALVVDEYSRDDPDLETIDARLLRYRGRLRLTSLSHLRVAHSRDGVSFAVDERPALWPETALESWGLEDPRITPLDDRFLVTVKAVSAWGVATELFSTRDFVRFERHGLIVPPENLDVVLFPGRPAGRFAALTRPVPRALGDPAVWFADSGDLSAWGGHRPVFGPRPGAWDAVRVGAGCPPLATDAGWLLLYHGVDETDRYRAGAALLARDEPWRVLARSARALLAPETPWEREGFYGGVVFPTGWVRGAREGELLVYYGAADEVTAGLQVGVGELLAVLEDGA
ncbi:MAG: glycoside hydrolase family 130 protein [Acidobacteriota bacterium]